MNVLIACEFSGIVRDAFTSRGHHAVSCDLLPTEAPGLHVQGDVLDILGDGWDLMIAHPPCTYLSSSGLHWNTRRPERTQQTDEAMAFVMALANAPIPRICIENPVGRIGTAWRKADQTIQPYQFGHDASKRTCLWLKGLPPLEGTSSVVTRTVCTICGNTCLNGSNCPSCLIHSVKPRWGNQTNSGQNKLGPSVDRWALRSATYPGIAEAMADQWGGEEA
jgi:hypothetical protein